MYGRVVAITGEEHCERSDGCVCAAVTDDTALDGGKYAVFRHAHFVIDGHIVPSATGCEHFVHSIHELDRLPCFLGEHYCAEISCYRIILCAAESSTDEGLDNTYLCKEANQNNRPDDDNENRGFALRPRP